MMKNLIKGLSKAKITPQQALTGVYDGIKMITTAIQENNSAISQETTKRVNITSLKEYEIEKIHAHKEVLKDYFEKIFAERRINFDKMFSALDKGIESNNLELIQLSLNSIVEIAKDSPLKQVQELKNDFHNPEIKAIEI